MTPDKKEIAIKIFPVFLKAAIVLALTFVGLSLIILAVALESNSMGTAGLIMIMLVVCIESCHRAGEAVRRAVDAWHDR
jgi:hypothetical protein